MANDNYKNKKLVSNNDDCTFDLTGSGLRATGVPGASAALERDAHVEDDDPVEDADALKDPVCELESVRAELHSESEKVASLEADLEARDKAHSSLKRRHDALTTELEDLRAVDADHVAALEKAEAELQARQDYVQTASEEITGLLTKIAEKDKTKTQLDERYADLQQQFEELRSGIAAKDAALEAAAQELENAGRDRESSDEGSPQAVLESITGSDVREFQAQIARTEDYADTLRRNLTDLAASHNEVVVQRDKLSRSLERITNQNSELTEKLARADVSIAEVRAAIEQQQTEQRAALDQLQADHAREIDALRKQLSEAQETATEATEMNERLAADLVQAREITQDQESTLIRNDERAKDRIEELEQQITQLTRTTQAFEHKLDFRGTTIRALLEELAKKSERIGSISNIDEIVDDIDDDLSGLLDDEAVPKEMTPKDQVVLANDDTENVSRVMIGNVGNKVLRFLLSKGRVTIGRTKENDIRLKTSYVSRQHAVVLMENDSARVIDSGSRNGVFVNSKRVKEHSLSNGDIVTIGDARLRYMERHERHA